MKTWANHGEENAFKLNNDPDYWAKFSRLLPTQPETRANSYAPVHLNALVQMMLNGMHCAPWSFNHIWMNARFWPCLVVNSIIVTGEASTRAGSLPPATNG